VNGIRRQRSALPGRCKVLPAEVGAGVGAPRNTDLFMENDMIAKPDDTMVFESTGRVIDANRNIVGIDPKMDVYSGYDDVVWEAGSAEFLGIDYDDDRLTRAERAELADYMIGLWTVYKESRAGG